MFNKKGINRKKCVQLKIRKMRFLIMSLILQVFFKGTLLKMFRARKLYTNFLTRWQYVRKIQSQNRPNLYKTGHSN